MSGPRRGRTGAEILAEACCSVLDVDEVDLGKSLFAHGADSLQALELLEALEEQVGQVVNMVAVFEAATLRDLAEMIDQAAAEPAASTDEDEQA